MITSVDCPCCSKLLYTTANIEGPYFAKQSGPPLSQDTRGAFMVCRHCNCRIDFVGAGQLTLSSLQSCEKVDAKLH